MMFPVESFQIISKGVEVLFSKEILPSVLLWQEISEVTILVGAPTFNKNLGVEVVS